MKIAVAKESTEGEKRVALTLEGVKELIASQHTISVEAGAGIGAFISDEAFQAAGATIGSAEGAELTLRLNPPTLAEVASLAPGSAHLSFLSPMTTGPIVQALAERQIVSFALDLMPRTSRAQSMDALSSMSTIAGYRAGLLAALHLPRFFPMLMTAAGTIPAARAFVIGAGVAGLQAIATCRRLGAIVEAFDVRPAVKEQIESLGGKFVGLSIVSDEAEDAGGYAKEVSGDTHARELELIASRLPHVDIVITTAMIPGKRAPILITDEMLTKMKPGSVIVDLAAPTGGNCEATVPGEVIQRHGITVMGRTDLLATMAADASRMLSKNICSYLGALTKEGALSLDMEDEIVKGTLITSGGRIVHDSVRLALERGGSA